MWLAGAASFRRALGPGARGKSPLQAPLGTPQGGPRPDDKYAAHVLTIASGDLLEPGTGAACSRQTLNPRP